MMRVLALAIVLALGGCAASPQEVATMSFGEPPSVDAAKIKSRFRYVLIDPESAMVETGFPYKAYVKKPLIAGGGVGWSGWAVDARINAKNRMGGFTGWQIYHVLLSSSGDVLDAMQAQEVEPLFFRVP